MTPTVRNVAWATVGTVFNQGSTLASNIWIANLLGKSRFGEFVIVLSTVQAAASVASLGIGYTATRYIAEWRHRDVARAGRLLGLFSRASWVAAVGAAALLALGAPGLANDALRAPELRVALLLAAATTVFTVRNGFITGALNGLEAYRFIGIGGMIAGVGYLALTVAGALTGGVTGAAWGLGLAALLQCGVLSGLLATERSRQGLLPGAARFADEQPLFRRFALPAALSGISTVPVLWLVQTLLARSPGGFGGLAVYGAGLNFLTMVLFVPTVLNGVAMAWINRTHVLEGDAAYRSALRVNVKATAITVTLALLAVVAFGPLLLSLYGRDFRAGYLALVLLLLAAVPEALTNALNQSLQRRERMWDAFFGINIPRDVVILSMAFVLIPRYDAVGAAAAYLTGRLVALGSMLYLVRDELRTTPVVAVTASPLAAE